MLSPASALMVTTGSELSTSIVWLRRCCPTLSVTLHHGVMCLAQRADRREAGTVTLQLPLASSESRCRVMPLRLTAIVVPFRLVAGSGKQQILAPFSVT